MRIGYIARYHTMEELEASDQSYILDRPEVRLEYQEAFNKGQVLYSFILYKSLKENGEYANLYQFKDASLEPEQSLIDFTWLCHQFHLDVLEVQPT